MPWKWSWTKWAFGGGRAPRQSPVKSDWNKECRKIVRYNGTPAQTLKALFTKKVCVIVRCVIVAFDWIDFDPQKGSKSITWSRKYGNLPWIEVDKEVITSIHHFDPTIDFDPSKIFFVLSTSFQSKLVIGTKSMLPYKEGPILTLLKMFVLYEWWSSNFWQIVVPR